MKKNNKNAAKISRYMSEFLYDYAPNFLTYSEHTIRSCNLRSSTATGAVVNGHSAVCQRPA